MTSRVLAIDPSLAGCAVATKRKRRNTAAKGAEIEKAAISILESLGYRIARAGKVLKRVPGKVPGTFRSITAQHDFFGAFDLVALRPDRPVLFVQVSVHAERSHKVKQVAPVLPAMPYEHSDAEIWGWVGGQRSTGGQRFRVVCWNGMEWANCEDRVLPPKPKRITADPARIAALRKRDDDLKQGAMF